MSPRNTRTYKRSHEPVAWSLFGAGGMVVAFLIPALALVSGLLMPHWEPLQLYYNLHGFAEHWLAKLVLLAVIALTLYHCVHRIYHGAHDLHLFEQAKWWLWLCYGGATVLSGLTAVILLQI